MNTQSQAVEIRIKPLNVFILLTGAAFGQNSNSTTVGDFTVEPATLVSLGFEWRIADDANRNAHVDVSYRKRGEQKWHEGLPLMRLQREEIGTSLASNSTEGRVSVVAPERSQRNSAASESGAARYPLFRYTAPNMFAGSILNLEPDTEYECRFTLADPDGYRAYAAGATTSGGRPCLSRVSGGLERCETGTRIHGSDGCILHGALALRLPECVPSARTAWGCDSGPRGTLSWRPPTLR